MENFITGYPGREYQIRETLAKTIGDEKAKFYFDKVYTFDSVLSRVSYN